MPSCRPVVKYRQILKCRPADLNNKYIGNYKNTDLPTLIIISANVKVPTCSPNIIIGTFKSADLPTNYTDNFFNCQPHLITHLIRYTGTQELHIRSLHLIPHFPMTWKGLAIFFILSCWS